MVKVNEEMITEISKKLHEIMRTKSAVIISKVSKIDTVVDTTTEEGAEYIALLESRAVPELEKEEWEDNSLEVLQEEYSDIKDTIETVCDTLVEQFDSRDIEDTVSEDLEPENYDGDDRSFRIALNCSVNQVKDVVPAWGGNRSFVFLKLYACIDQVLNELLDTYDTTISFERDYFENQFLPYVRENGLKPPYDIWRRINLCAQSQAWKNITISAFRRLSEVAVLDEARYHGLDPAKAAYRILGWR